MGLKLDSQLWKHFGSSEPLVPVLLSVPHSGTLVTKDFKQICATPSILSLPDTDWHVDRVYDFAAELGVFSIKALYSRYIIDLNRPGPDQPPLYHSRKPTSLIPLVTFAGDPIYQQGNEPTEQKIIESMEEFYQPYYTAIENMMEECISRFGKVLLIDGHSIRSSVKSIQEESFPDFILGNRKGETCPPEIMEKAKNALESNGFQCSLNDPFQGGQITRYFHKQIENSYTLQIEMSQSIYMNEETGDLITERFNRTQRALRDLVKSLISDMKKRCETD